MAEAPRAPEEIELKLQIEADDPARVLAHPLIRRLARGRSQRRRLRSVYFDTPELALYQRGLAVRLRDAERGRIQTVKSRGEARAGLYRRAEDQTEVAGTSPELWAITDPELRAAVYAETEERGRTLHPSVETEVRRVTRQLIAGETEIELALDVGELRTHRGAEPIRELELELVHGDPIELYDLGLELAADLPLRLSTQSKAERGFASLLGLTPAPSRARRVELDADATLDDALAAIFAECLRQITANLEPAAEGADPEGVHQLRVATRRLRSALSLLRAQLPAELGRELRDELRGLASALGPARDLDVFLAETLEPILALQPAEAHLKRLRDAALEARADAYDRVREAVTSPRTTRLLLRLGRTLSSRAWRDQPLSPESARLFSPARAHAAELLGRHHRKALRGGRDLTHRPVEDLHRLRITLKKLRYLGEFFAGLYPRKPARRVLRRAARLQDALGHLNDSANAEALLSLVLSRLGSELGPDHHRAAGFVMGWIQRGGSQEIGRIEARWRRFAAAAPFWVDGDGR